MSIAVKDSLCGWGGDGNVASTDAEDFASAKEQIENGPNKAGGIEVMISLAFFAHSNVKAWAAKYMRDQLNTIIGSEDDAASAPANSL